MRLSPRRAIASLTMLALALILAAPVAAAQVGYKAIGDAIERARELDDVFGGAWLEGDGVVFAFTRRATDEQVADVLALIRPGTPVTTVLVDWSEAELDATNEAITDALVGRELTFVTGVGTDLKNNAVVVSIHPRYFEICQAGLVARYGPVRLLFERSEGDVGAEGHPGADASPAPSGSPAASLPPGCLPPASPGPSLGPLPSAVPPTSSPVPSGMP